jgi:hypothetical protein
MSFVDKIVPLWMTVCRTKVGSIPQDNVVTPPTFAGAWFGDVAGIHVPS